MGDKSNIQWTEATWNPTTGCTKVSQGCKNCYAKHQAWPRLKMIPTTVYYGREFEDVQVHGERLDQPLRWKKPRKIFVNSMSDLFHEDIPSYFIDDVLATMAAAPQHIFQVLTKRPERMRHLLGDRDIKKMLLDDYDLDVPWPLPNVWLGVSVEDQFAANDRIPLLLKTPALVRWISAEPLLGPVTLTGIARQEYEWVFFDDALTGFKAHKQGGWMSEEKLNWVVVGGESGKGARHMKPSWARAIRDECLAANVPFFMKQMSGASKAAMPPIPSDLDIRQYPQEQS